MKLKLQLRHLWNSFCSLRCLTLLLVWLFIMDVELKAFWQQASVIGEKGSFMILPFLQTDSYFNKVMLLGVISFFSNAPFLDRHEMYVMIRSGKERWGKRNIYYIFMSSFLLALFLILASALMTAPTVSFRNEWGTLFHTLSAAAEKGRLGFFIFGKAITTYTPYQLGVIILIVDSLAFSLLGMILYTLSLYLPRVCCYLCVVALAFLPSMENFMPFSIRYYSPFSWIYVTKWRYGNDLSNPSLLYIVAGYVLLLLLLAMAAQYKIHKIDWKSQEET